MTIRIYQDQELRINDTCYLDDAASHHVGRVLRANVGESVAIFNGKGEQYEGTIAAITKRQVAVTLVRLTFPSTESPLNLHLAQGIARGEKMDWIIQKAVELGVKAIYPLMTERTNALPHAKKLAHWQAVAVSACEQSGRLMLPKIHAPMTLGDYLAELSQPAFVLSPHNAGELPAKSLSSASIIVGPEGGLSEKEVELAISHGCQALQLGPRILRTETAGIVAASLLQARYGDMGIG